MAAMDVHDAIILTLLANGGRVYGRAAIQKLVYFQTQKIRNLEAGRYKHHFYGPYCPEVAVALENMGDFDLLDEMPVRGRYESYSYSLTERGRRFAEKVKARHAAGYEAIARVVRRCRAHSGLEELRLSYAAKAHQMLSDGGARKPAAAEVLEAGRRFGWNVRRGDAEAGVALLRSLELAA